MAPLTNEVLISGRLDMAPFEGLGSRLRLPLSSRMQSWLATDGMSVDTLGLRYEVRHMPRVLKRDSHQFQG